MLIPTTVALLADVVRGDRSRRPPRDDASAAGLRALLEDHFFELLGPQLRVTPLIISSANLRGTGSGRDLGDGTLSHARGMIVSTIFRLLVAQVHVEDPFDDAVTAWRGDRPRDPLLDAVLHLDPDQSARLRADVEAHYRVLLSGLGTIPSSWLPRTSLRVRQLLAGGNAELRDVIDLMVGSNRATVANVALVDITTSPLGAGAERAMRYHALVQTLRSGVVPLRTVAFSSATGEFWALDVDHALLVRAVGDVVDVVARATVTP